MEKLIHSADSIPTVCTFIFILPDLSIMHIEHLHSSLSSSKLWHVHTVVLCDFSHTSFHVIYVDFPPLVWIHNISK